MGVEGHEFAVEEEEDGGGVALESEEEEDEDAAILPQKGRVKRKRNNAYEEANDDSDVPDLHCCIDASTNRCTIHTDARARTTARTAPMPALLPAQHWFAT